MRCRHTSANPLVLSLNLEHDGAKSQKGMSDARGGFLFQLTYRQTFYSGILNMRLMAGKKGTLPSNQFRIPSIGPCV